MSEQEKQRNPRIGALQTAIDCRRELARIYRAGREGKVATQDMTRFASVLQILIGAIRDGDFEERLKALEEQQHLPNRGSHGASKQH